MTPSERRHLQDGLHLLAVEVAHLKSSRTIGAKKALLALSQASAYLGSAAASLKSTNKPLAEILSTLRLVTQ